MKDSPADGYAVVTFSSPQAFVESLTTSVPQCLVVDVQMPEVNGFKLQSRLRALGHQMPVLFITAQDTPQTRHLAAQTGSIGVLLYFQGSRAHDSRWQRRSDPSCCDTSALRGPNSPAKRRRTRR